MNYFNICSRIFEYGLSPSELTVYCAVSSVRNCLNHAVCSVRSLANRTGLSQRTVCRALDGLQLKKLLSMHKRYRFDGTRAANGYTLASIHGGKFKVDRSIWKHKLDAAGFAVYLYITKTANNLTKLAHPSLRKIACALDICRNTVIAKVRMLQERMLLVKENRKARHTNRFICNEHTLLDLASGFICPLPKRSRTKEKERIAVRPFKLLPSFRATVSKLHGRIPSVFSLARLKSLCKRFQEKFTVASYFLKVGGSFLAEQVLYPLRLQQKKE